MDLNIDDCPRHILREADDLHYFYNLKQVSENVDNQGNCVYDFTMRLAPEDLVQECKHQAQLGIEKAKLLKQYEIHITIPYDKEMPTQGSCNCFRGIEDEYCCHIIAAFNEAKKRAKATRKDVMQLKNAFIKAGDGKRLLTALKPTSLTVMESPKLRLIPHMHVSAHGHYMQPYLTFKLGYSKLYVLRGIRSFIEHSLLGQPVTFGKGLVINTASMAFQDGRDSEMWQWLVRIYQDEHQILSTTETRYSYAGWGYVDLPASYIFKKNKFLMTNGHMGEFLQRWGHEPFELSIEEEPDSTMVQLAGEGVPEICFRLQGAGKKAVIGIDRKEPLLALTDDYRYILQKGIIYHVSEDFASRAVSVLQNFNEYDSLQLSMKDMGQFMGSQLAEWKKFAQIQIDESLEEKFDMVPLTAQIYLDYYMDGVEASLKFIYGDDSFNPLGTNRLPAHRNRAVIVRDYSQEEQLLNIFRSFGFAEQEEIFVQPGEAGAYEFLSHGLPVLAEMPHVEIFYTDSFSTKPVTYFNTLTLGVNVNDANLLELTVKDKEFNYDEIIAILTSYRKKKRYHKLADGRFVSLEEQQLDTMADLMASLEGELDANGQAQLPLSKAMYLDALGREEEGIRLEKNQRFRRVTKALRNPDDSEAVIPASLEPVLREYQVTGVSWLTALSRLGLGGILADDMGLGKTLQVIAFLLAEKAKDNAYRNPALVVAPTSLIYNWQDEIRRFGPSLQFQIIDGNKASRKQMLESTESVQPDVIITTYHMLRSDIANYKKRNFSYCFLDEAQHIKNPTTKVAKAVKQIKAGCCFALTGTPMENNLTELWSIFDYLMPGYLNTYRGFKSQYENPIVKNKDAAISTRLVCHVKPFVLRRMKKDVLKELPDKIERRMLNEMTEEQSKVYDAYFVQARKDLRQELEKHGFGESKVKILAMLTRLRQIACDPAIFLESYEGGSGKLDMLEEVVGEAVESGHHILVFSQFTSMLHRIAQRLDSNNICYSYLDGQTPARERLALVKEFNQQKVPVFLISLKAGGTGLNLVGADMVIHYDPWWNPAVEDQATDRAYRIGQKNNVQVLKFITKDTIEERIYELQQKKKSLIDQMIQPGESFISKLADEEILELFNP